MKILVIGNGGREHALIWKLSLSANNVKLYCTLGNAGINQLAEPIDIKPDDIKSLLNFALQTKIDLTVVGPELPLSLGIVDEFNKCGLKIFGPTQSSAKLETSKIFAKEFMKRYGIPTAQFLSFNHLEKNKALDYLSNADYPLVIKADGLAGGKGVVICDDLQTAKNTILNFFENKIFGTSGENVVVEEFLKGNEASIFVISDGQSYVLLSPAQDHKKILDGEKGKNTGGMGSFAPAHKVVSQEVLNKVNKNIIEPVLNYINQEGNPYKGCLYVGLMIDENNEPYVLEFNVRFGDPESQVVIPLIKSNFLELLLASCDNNIKNYSPEFSNEHYCAVVLASNGYPDEYETGKEIYGLNKIDPSECLVFHAGTKTSPDGKIFSSGGRVLNVVGKSDKDLKSAIDIVYKNIQFIHFENMYYRTDIGRKGITL